MTADARRTPTTPRRTLRRRVAVACGALLVALAGCKSDKGAQGSGVSRGRHDPLFASGPNLIPRQNVPIPDRATGPKGRGDPLTTPTGGKSGDKVGYSDDPERFKGSYVPSLGSTPAALASRLKDGDELKIDDTDGVPLKPAGGTLAGGSLTAPAEVAPLYAELERRGVKREDRDLVRENGKWTFRASLPNAQGAKTQYTGVADTAADAVKQVLKQIN
jgi:hypothetical protein